MTSSKVPCLFPLEGLPTLKVAHFVSGVKRKCSIAELPADHCKWAGVAFVMHEVDMFVGGSEHDLLDRESQDNGLGQIDAGEFYVCLRSPPCSS